MRGGASTETNAETNAGAYAEVGAGADAEVGAGADVGVKTSLGAGGGRALR